MSNTNGTTNANVIAQEALVQLKAKLPIIRQIATDLTDQKAKYGETVIVHEVQAGTAATFNPTTGYVAEARTQVDIPVTINLHKHHTYAIGVQEASSSRVDLIKRYGLNAAYVLGSAIVSSLVGLVTNAAYANKSVIALGAGGDGFNRKSVVKINGALSKRGVNPFERFGLLNSDFYASLMSDDSLMNLLALSGAKPVAENMLPPVHGVGISEFVDLADNGEDLVGFIGGRTALALATRIPDDPGAGESNVRITVETDADTGLALQVREWYDATLAKFSRTYTLMYGVSVGQAAALQRIVAK
jgi:hypothetical protein